MPVNHAYLKKMTMMIFIVITSVSAMAQVRTVDVYVPDKDGDHYVNNAVMTHFKGRFYCMWQSSAMDEDSPDTHVMYSTSRNCRKWSRPVMLAENTDSTFASPGGWIVHGDTLTAFINVLGDIKTGGTAHYKTSCDGRTWSDMKPVRMADGSSMNGILEQDPHILECGRIVGAAHFKPGLKARPIYTDDPTGQSGWKVGIIEMEDRGNQSRGIEPSLYIKPDGTIVMLFRDQASSFRKIASESHDNGVTWSKPYITELIDSRCKQCAGNLPEGTAFIVSNPIEAKDRTSLGITFSKDGMEFGNYIMLRTPEDLRPKEYEGKYKTQGYSYPKALIYKNMIYISYSENKEKVVITTIDIDKIR